VGDVVDLRSDARDWREVMIGGGTPAVQLDRLHVDRATNATTSLVRFPEGWSRPDTGYYPCAEEVLVIEGEITVSGATYRAGDYGYMPPFHSREDSSSSGCLVLAWFSGPPGWNLGDATGLITHEPAHSKAAVAYRPARSPQGAPGDPGHALVQGRAATVAPLGERRVPGVVELVDLASWRWTLLGEDEPYPDWSGAVFTRLWS